jgi:hypothetical protein
VAGVLAQRHRSFRGGTRHGSILRKYDMVQFWFPVKRSSTRCNVAWRQKERSEQIFYFKRSNNPSRGKNDLLGDLPVLPVCSLHMVFLMFCKAVRRCRLAIVTQRHFDCSLKSINAVLSSCEKKYGHFFKVPNTGVKNASGVSK